ncbi:hypothetical protein GCM10009789_36710 [Kribbella sancticallisti]|uniref:Uncharacterized protein n=1 Tax=Kribbella sancticallisti TaxID=460087 RepID=A0ABN2DKV4_9ACTN
MRHPLNVTRITHLKSPGTPDRRGVDRARVGSERADVRDESPLGRRKFPPRRLLGNLGGGRTAGASLVAERAVELIHKPALALQHLHLFAQFARREGLAGGNGPVGR